MMTNEEIAQLALLEQRVETLEEADKKHVEFRKEYYKDREDRIYRDAQLDIKINSINENIAKLVTWQEAQQSKPAKRWEGIVDKAITALAAALVGFALAQIGIM